MRKLSEETKRKIALAHTGKKRPPFSAEWIEKIRQKSIGRKHTEEAKLKISNAKKGKGRKHSEETKAKMRLSKEICSQRILKECVELEKQGFRAIPTGWKVIPDIIALKDNKVYAVEVEYGTPNYSKYTDEVKQYFDDIIWILRKRNQ